MKIFVFILFMYTLSIGSVFLKETNIDQELQLKKDIFLNSYMLDQDVSESDLKMFLELGFIAPDEDSWLYIIDYHKASIIAIGVQDYLSAQRVWEKVATKYDDKISQYNLSHLYALGLLPDTDHIKEKYWRNKIEIESKNLISQENTVQHWEIRQVDGVGIIYETTGENGLNYNSFGFIKLINQCNENILLLNFMDKRHLDVKEDINVSIEWRTPKETYEFEHVLYYTNIENSEQNIWRAKPIYVNEEFTSMLHQIKYLNITILQPIDVVENLVRTTLDIDMSQFNNIQAEAEARCILYSQEYNITKSEASNQNDDELNSTTPIQEITQGIVTKRALTWLLLTLLFVLLLVWVKLKKK